MTPLYPILVPRRADGGWRDQLWEHCHPRLPAVPIIEGESPDGPFNRSAAINDASRAAGDWTVAVIVDGDVILPAGNIDRAVELAHTSEQLTFAYTRRRNLDMNITRKMLQGWPVTIDGHVRTDLPLWPESMTCSSCLAVPRHLWDAVGGFDERFQGWGWDDVAFHRACHTIGGGQQAVEGDLLHLWHSRPVERNNTAEPQFQANKTLGQRYKDALGDPEAITALLSEPGGPLETALEGRLSDANDSRVVPPLYFRTHTPGGLT